MREQIDGDHFRSFAFSLERAIAKYSTVSETTLLKRQKRQVETLVRLERKFRKKLTKHRWGPGVYKSFVKMITEDKRNILAARPYFRERQGVFTSDISKALKERDFMAIGNFHFNFTFIRWVLGARKWAKGSPLVKIAEEVAAMRCELTEMNMPLAISRARIFWSRTPRAQLSYMDLVQISCEGLMAAIDKFCLPYSPVFRAVAIGRISGNFIQEYSETLIHFYPADKRKIYRAHKLMSKVTGDDFDKLAEKVNTDMGPNQLTTPSEIADLVAASSMVSVDGMVSSEATGDKHLQQYENSMADESTRPDVIVEQREAKTALYSAVNRLSAFERKLLRLRGLGL